MEGKSERATYHLGSVSGNIWPMSGSARAPRIASVTVWRSTSPSECATQPTVCGMSTPPMMSLYPSSNLQGASIALSGETQEASDRKRIRIKFRHISSSSCQIYYMKSRRYREDPHGRRITPYPRMDEHPPKERTGGGPIHARYGREVLVQYYQSTHMRENSA